MRIKNLAELSTTPERRAVLEIAEKGLEAIDTVEVIKKSLKISGDELIVFGKNFKISPNGKLIAVCIGKCAALGAYAFEQALGERLDSGTALGVGESAKVGPSPARIKYYAGTHPMPSEANVIGTRAILNSLAELSAKDTVLFLISGGGSTLLAQPPCSADKTTEAISKEKEALSALFKAGATIQEINTVRKHASLARGGFLAKAAYPAQIISIIFSDVPGNELGFISSGPTAKDETTVNDAEEIVKKYNLDLPEENFVETPKDDSLFARVYNILAVSNELALLEMKKTGEALGFNVLVKNTRLVGEARDVGKAIAEEINAAEPNTILLYCGETTVTVKGSLRSYGTSATEGGKGGRNQELALAALSVIKNGCVVLSLASDGHDNGPHAGAFVEKELFNGARAKNIDPNDFLERNDSSTFFEKVGDGLIETGDTGSNISDLMIAIRGKS